MAIIPLPLKHYNLRKFKLTHYQIFDAMAKYLGVHYIYENDQHVDERRLKKTTRKALTPEALAGLPDDLLAELHQAIIDLDVDLIKTVTGRIRKLNATVADGLEDLADNFQYDKQLALLQQRLEAIKP